MDRPVAVKCSTMPKITASTMKMARFHGIWVPGSGLMPMPMYPDGKSETVLGPSRISATPRYSARVPIVTASEGSPTRVTSRPLISPARMPTRATTTKMASMGHPLAHRKPSSALDIPRIEATDRSISPLMMISVMGSAMIAISPAVTAVLKKLPVVRNLGDDIAPKITMAMTSSPSPLSQRSEARAAGPSRSRQLAAFSAFSAFSAFAAFSVRSGRSGRSGANAGTPSSQGGLQPQRDHPVERDGEQQQEAGDGLQPQRGDSQHVQRRVDGRQQQGAHRRADGAAAAPEDGHAADHHRGDHGQLVTGPRAGVDGLVLRGPQDPGQSGDGAADRERGEHPAAHRYGRQPRRLRVRADRVQFPPGP